MGITTKDVSVTGNASSLLWSIPRALYDNGGFCKNAKDLKYIVYIYSAVGHAAQRKMLRATWANAKLYKDHAKFLFFVGKAKTQWWDTRLHDEIEANGDLVVGDFDDTYRNLSLKGLFALNWISKYCRSARFAIKADDDTFLNVFKLTEILNKLDSAVESIVGTVYDGNMPILRKRPSCMKWCVGEDWFPGEEFYPRYTSGLFYAISSSLVPKLVVVAKTAPIFWIEDVYITGILPPKVGNVTYVPVNENATLNIQHALGEYGNRSRPITYIAVLTQGQQISLLWKRLASRMQKHVKSRVSFAQK